MTARLIRLFLLAFLAPLALRAAPRVETNLNAGWRFHYGELPGAETVAFNDSAWARVDVPHTWNAQDGQDGVKDQAAVGPGLKGDYARGSGWYRRVVKGSADWAGRRVYLQFDGANRRADVFINGRFLGTHLGGNARFRFDATDALRRDGDNLVAVRVNNEDNEILPHSADYTFFGGIYRGVTLLVTDALQIETMDHASPGVYLEQKSVSAERAEVRVRVKLANHADRGVAEVTVTVLDDQGRKAVAASGRAEMAAGGRGEMALPLVIDRPRLWNGREDPYLYRVRVEVAAAGVVRDAVEQPLGLRYFRVDPAKGFFLNGRYLDLRGVSRHQDRLDKGWAISDADDREDFALITEMGCTAIRVAHYQQSPLWYRLADEAGMVLWAEIPFVDEALNSEVFFNNALEQMRELVRQNYNHPSIVFWGCGNENFDAGQSFAEGIAKYGPMSERLIQALHALTKAEDPTRITTYASFHSEKDVSLALPGQPAVNYKGEPQRWYTDTTAFNKYYGWYYGEPQDYGVYLDDLHQRNPTQPIGISEYGAGGSIRQHTGRLYGRDGAARTPMESIRRSAFGKDHPEDYQAYFHEESWRVMRDRPYIWAKFIWNMFDFAVDWRNEGDTPGRNDKGMVTIDRRTRKDAFFFYKANWSGEPVLHIANRRFTARTDGVTEIKVYTNAPEAEVFLNGLSLGRKKVGEDRIVRWEKVPLAPGENRVRASAVAQDRTLTDECAWTLRPSAKP
jgi:beta-galactosidase